MSLAASAGTAATAGVAMPAAAPAARHAEVDVFRGLLIAHMALDHVSLMFNAGRPGEELAAAAPAVTGELLQFLTRFTGVPVAPGFFFMAGFMVALTSAARSGHGVAEAGITRRLLLRGLVLIAVDTLLMGLPRALMGFYSFMVLSCIGLSLMLLAALRQLPDRVLLSGALAVLVLHPLLDVSALPLPLRAILYEPVREGAFRSLYPLLPWSAILVVGYVAGRDALTRSEPQRLWLRVAALCLLVFFAVRLAGGYGNAYATVGIASREFWSFAKYPPDLPFLAWSGAAILLSLAALRRLCRASVPALLRPLAVYGRVPLFFYVLHFYVLGIAAAVAKTRFGLAPTYLLWLALLAAMVWPCAAYHRLKQRQSNGLRRYF